METSSAMQLLPETGHRCAERSPSPSPTGNRQPCGSMVCDLDDCDREVINIIMGFVDNHAYLSVAIVSTRWRDAWGQRPRMTSLKWAVQSCSCLDWARACGLDISSKSCLFAAVEGRLDVLQHAVSLGYSREGMPICEYAAAEGHLEVVKWCRANGYPWGLSKLLAAEGGHLEVLQWCIASNAPDVARTTLVRISVRGSLERIPGVSETAVLNAAVEGGHLETVIWCWQQGYRWNDRTCYLAAKGGHLELLRWLRNKGCPWSGDTMIGAIDADDPEMLEWCTANNCTWNGHVQSIATKRGNLEIVKWCVANDPNGDILDRTCCDAAAHGHLEVVQWLRVMGFRWGGDLCFLAVRGGHFEVLKWCIANGCPWENVPWHGMGFEFHGTVPIMVWATANGCPWMADPPALNRLCWHAAAGGNLEVLKWCSTNHDISSSRDVEAVAGNGYVHVLEWLRANTGVLDSYMDQDLYIGLCWTAAASGSLETVKWCRANGYPWCQEACDAAARSGNLELLQWCRANGCPWDIVTCGSLIECGNFEMLAWCRDNGCPPERRWRESSLLGGRAEMIEWCWECSPSESSVQAARSVSPLV